tara:strand:+ start:3429 stop:6188 length:2760 start_codon:yes stop_codon:yes gene_type:complete
MPKQIFKIDSFVGGLNTATDKQAIEDVELALSDGVETFDKGRINLIGQFEEQTYENPISGEGIKDFDCYPGTGLFQFKSDKVNGHIHYEFQHGEVEAIIPVSDTNPIAMVTVRFENPQDIIIPANAFKDCEIFVRDHPYLTGQFNEGRIFGSKILSSSQSLGTLINMEITSEDYEVSLDGSVGGNGEVNVLWTGNRVSFSAKNEEVEYFAKSSFHPFIRSGVQLYSHQKEGGKIWGPLEYGYPLGTRLNTRPKTSFYYVDGALRWSDGESANFSANDEKSNQFLGYLKTSIVHEDNINDDGETSDYRAHALEVNGWWQGDAFLSPPEIGIPLNDSNQYKVSLSAVLFASQGASVYLPAQKGEFVVAISYGIDTFGFDGTGTWSQIPSNQEEWKYNYYVSYVYLGGGESALSSLGSVYGEHENANMVIEIAVNDSDFLSDRRIVGIKLYWQKAGTASWSGASSKNYMFLCEFNLEKGFQSANDTTFDRLVRVNYLSPERRGLKSKMFEFKDPPLISSWEAETGHFRSDIITDVRFQTSVIANRRVYIGNITYDGVNYEDLILQSNTNQFDTFPFSNRLETTRLDGSEIVRLEEYADRLLQFKSDRLDIINISGELDILEESFPYKGIRGPGAVCKTDYGVAWVNEDGCYLFDGTQITNLLERQNVRLIDAKEWKDFIRFGKDGDSDSYDNSDIDVSPVIGYIPKDRRLIIANADCLTKEDTKVFYMCNLLTQSWAKSDQGQTGLQITPSIADEFNTAGRYLSNFINDKNGDLLVALSKTHQYGVGQGELVLFKDKNNQTIVDRNFSITTKAYDFGMPGVDKKIHKVYFHYKGQGSLVSIVMYSDISGDSGELHRFADSSGNVDATPLSDSLTTDNTEGFKVYNNTAKKVKRIWFQIDGLATDYNFELYDINVVFRAKSIK